MNSVDSPASLVAANARLWRLVHLDEMPLKFWVLGSLVPLACRSIVYVLLGQLLAGAAGAHYAFVGVVALAITGQTVQAVSDIPLMDTWMKTYPAVSRGRLPVSVQYLARSGVLMVFASAEALFVCLAVAPLTGQLDLVVPVLARSWMLVPAIVSCTLFGLAVISVSIANDTQNLVQNAAAMVLVITSGAMLTRDTAGWLHTLGGFLPLQHALTALRSSLAGGPWARELALETAVALGWAIVTLVAYRVVDARARHSGRGAGQ